MLTLPRFSRHLHRADSFLATYKRELLYHRHDTIRDDAKWDMLEYLSAFHRVDVPSSIPLPGGVHDERRFDVPGHMMPAKNERPA